MTATVGTPAEQTVHRDPPPAPAANMVIDQPATVQACNADYAQAHKGGGR